VFDTPFAKSALALAALAIVIDLGTRVLPGLNEAARLDVDQSSGLTPGNEALQIALAAGQTFVPAASTLAGIDLAFETVPEQQGLEVRLWPDGPTVVQETYDGSRLACREPHQGGRGASCRLRWEGDVG
jgi:hypothetical protein